MTTPYNLPSNPGPRPPALPDLIYPQRRWQDEDYAQLITRLDCFSDFIVLSKYRAGAVSEQFIVDPAELAAALSGITLSSGLLPRETLFWSKQAGQARLGIYVPPQVWTVSVRDEPEAWRVPLPGLIVVGHGYDYHLWAVTARPTDVTTRLYLAPCPNVHEGVCRGSAPFPLAGPTTMVQAVEAFFGSRFNRDLSNGKSKTYPDCVLDQWRTLHQSQVESYPLADLVETPFTLRRLLDG